METLWLNISFSNASTDSSIITWQLRQNSVSAEELLSTRRRFFSMKAKENTNKPRFLHFLSSVMQPYHEAIVYMKSIILFKKKFMKKTYVFMTVIATTKHQRRQSWLLTEITHKSFKFRYQDMLQVIQQFSSTTVYFKIDINNNSAKSPRLNQINSYFTLQINVSNQNRRL